MSDLDKLIDLFVERTNLPKHDDDHVVNDDTQVGIEFAFEQMNQELEQAKENAMMMMRRDADRLESIGKLVTKLEAANKRIAKLEDSGYEYF